jgi:peptidoglycan/xylan/chitin deacetylase (PgdA/CDA1 family)
MLRQPGVKIAMLHRVGRPALGGRLRGLSFSPTALDAFLSRADRLGLPDVPLSEYATKSPGLVITFDDGFAGLVSEALPILRKRRRTATTYVLAGMLGQWNVWDAAAGARQYRLMDKQQLAEWLRGGQRIGSHGLTHRSLLKMPLNEARMEISDSRKRLSDLFGRSIDDFCYPYGDHSPAIEAMVQEAGYRTAVTTVHGTNDSRSNPFALKRFAVQHRRPWLAALLPDFLAANV